MKQKLFAGGAVAVLAVAGWFGGVGSPAPAEAAPVPSLNMCLGGTVITVYSMQEALFFAHQGAFPVWPNDGSAQLCARLAEAS